MNSREILLDSFKKYCLDTIETCKKNFFQSWFINNGKSYCFVFKQNLFVTNIQFRELLDLIQLNVQKTETTSSINFLTTDDFNKLVADIIESFIDETELEEIREKKAIPTTVNDRLEVICNNYINLFENTIIVDAFYTSCMIALPCRLEIDIVQMCYQSGYIHSCGENIYIRNIRKAKYKNFVEKLYKYSCETSECINLILYSHEQYSIKNKLYVSAFEKHGLDEIKFYQQKFYMKDMSLMELAARLNNDDLLKGKIYVTNKEEVKNKNNNASMWMIIDRSVGDDLKYPGEQRYYICYKQLYINENPFHVFDEDKPGWINHVTIPHTLVGAMINIGICECIKNGKKCKVIDPFVGSGTTFLETLKNKDIDFYGGDISLLAKKACKLNLDFFAMSTEEIKCIADFILVYIKYINNDKYVKIIKDLNKKEDTLLFNKHRNVIITLQHDLISLEKDISVEEIDFAQKFNNMVKRLENDVVALIKNDSNLFINKENANIICQIWLYVAWKTYKRNEYVFKNNLGVDVIDESFEEFKGLYYRITTFLHIRKRGDSTVNDFDESDRLLIYFGKYSKGCSLNYKFLKHESENYIKKIQDNIDVVEFLQQFEKEKVDLIVTDPPYGFNTIEEKENFSKLYIAFINKMVQCMKNGGQIIMCLPACSYSGREVNIFAQKEIVFRQFALAAKKNNMFLVEKEESLPQPSQLYSFPFYWDSEKALRRDILRFQFFKNEN